MMKTLLCAAFLVVSGMLPSAQVAPPAGVPPDAEIEQFLKKARIVSTRGIGKGITGTTRATLSDGTLTHDAQIQAIDEYRKEFVGQQGTERDFRDSWAYNVAAYKIDRLIGLNLVPVSVGRSWRSGTAAFTWWVDDVLMDEEERLKKKMPSPDIGRWNEQMQLVRVFDQLIGNVDRNLGNLLITSAWRVWAIDHSRAFRLTTSLKTPQNVTRCDRQMLERMKALDEKTLRKAIGSYMYTTEIRALLSRRDEIVRILDQAGPSALFDRQ